LVDAKRPAAALARHRALHQLSSVSCAALAVRSGLLAVEAFSASSLWGYHLHQYCWLDLFSCVAFSQL